MLASTLMVTGAEDSYLVVYVRVCTRSTSASDPGGSTLKDRSTALEAGFVPLPDDLVRPTFLVLIPSKYDSEWLPSSREKLPVVIPISVLSLSVHQEYVTPETAVRANAMTATDAIAAFVCAFISS